MEGIKLLLLEKVDGATMRGRSDYLVAMDAVGAGAGEIVLCVSGSSSRMTSLTEGKPSDAAIIGIVDLVDCRGETVYRKDGASR